MGDIERIEPKVLGSIGEVAADAWDACDDSGNPFLRHAFLAALEESGSAAPATGWTPRHLVLPSADGGLEGAVPLYLKAHSQGEYVFDHSWAEAFARAGGDYYPKLQAAIPFTPVTGPRLMAREGRAKETVRAQLLDAIAALGERMGVSSAHIAFLTEEEWRLAGTFGWLQRMDQQFHWTNRGYRTFEDFLGDLASRKRKAVRRERREALAPGIAPEILVGEDIHEDHWDAFFAFYRDTGGRKWGRPYLNRRFFSLLGEKMAANVVLMLYKRAGRYIAGALNLEGGGVLYGRYWGCIEDHPFLHFEACYYQAIDYAIERGLSRVEAGAQGPHKLARGYAPSPTYSAHWIAHPAFREAVARFLEHERAHVSSAIGALQDYTPFKKNG